MLIAVDTSDEPLKQLGKRLEGAAPDVVKPNAFELGQLAGLNGDELERRAESGDLAAVIDAAKELVEKGIGEVLVTLGGDLHDVEDGLALHLGVAQELFTPKIE